MSVKLTPLHGINCNLIILVPKLTWSNPTIFNKLHSVEDVEESLKVREHPLLEEDKIKMKLRRNQVMQVAWKLIEWIARGGESHKRQPSWRM